MKTSDKQPNKWSEADVDRLLTRFFAQEMPAELRRRTQSTNSITQPSSTSSAGSNRMVWAGMVATAAALMLAVIVTRSTVPETPDKAVANTELVPTDPAVPLTDRIETDEGTVQLKTWLVKDQDTDPGMDLRGIHIDIEYDVEPDEDDLDSAKPESPSAKSTPQSPAVPEND